MKLSGPAEEVATFFAKMLDHEYTTKDIFRKNFFKDWRKVRKNVSVLRCTQRVVKAFILPYFFSFILGNDIRGKVCAYWPE